MRSGFISTLCTWDSFCYFSSIYNISAVRIASSNIHLTQGSQIHSPGSDSTFPRGSELAQAEVGLVGLPHPGQVWSSQARSEDLPCGGAEGCLAAASALAERYGGMHLSGKAGQSGAPTEEQLRETQVTLEGASWDQGTCSAATPARCPSPRAAAAAALTGPGGSWQPRRRGGHQLTAPGSASSRAARPQLHSGGGGGGGSGGSGGSAVLVPRLPGQHPPPAPRSASGTALPELCPCPFLLLLLLLLPAAGEAPEPEHSLPRPAEKLGYSHLAAQSSEFRAGFSFPALSIFLDLGFDVIFFFSLLLSFFFSLPFFSLPYFSRCQASRVSAMDGSPESPTGRDAP